MTKKIKVLIVDKVHEILIREFEKAGWVCHYLDTITPQQVWNTINAYQGLIIRSKLKITQKLIDKAEQLQFIGRVGSGLENIDVAYAESKGIKCFNSPEGNRTAVGEHTLGLLLNLANKINIANQQVKQGRWLRDANWGVEIEGQTVGIIGYGNMGSAFAQRLYGFNCRILAYDKYKTGFGNEFVEEANLNTIFQQSDIVSIHVPLTHETRHMADLKFFSQFHKKIILLNTARGEIVKTSDLVTVLSIGKIQAAGLDVLEYEKHTFEELHQSEIPEDLQYLMKAENVIITPHIAGWTHQAFYKLSAIMAQKILSEFTS